MPEAVKNPPAAAPLQGITVVELGHSVAAPFAGQTLADLGATVVKIENPDRGDDARNWGPPFWNGAAVIFQSVNRNKMSAAVNMKDPGTTRKTTRLHRHLGRCRHPEHARGTGDAIRHRG